MTTYIIIDDEPLAHDIIEEYAENLENLTLKKNCYNIFEAIEYLNENTIDLIFLDIHMPKVNGFEFLKSLTHPPKIIVTTAYKEYAIEGYELNIIDYLLKPFGLNRFLKAIYKATKKEQPIYESLTKKNKTIFLKDGKTYHQVSIHDILFIQAMGNYTKVFTHDQVIITLEKLSVYLSLLSETNCIQIHKSYIVMIPKIEQIKENKVVIGEHILPVGQTYRQNVDSILKR